MKLKTMFMIGLALVVGAVASAQEYAVRVRHNTNLRASYSLQSVVVEKVGTGTILDVTGSFNRWLEVERGGNTVWMADWVPMTRVDSAPAPAVDNCCFVDRQCASEGEWTDGYWAYQRNECPAPAPAQPETPAQSPAGSSANVDNCCFLGWQCQSSYDWIVGYESYQKNQCEHGSPEKAASSSFDAKVNAALNLLKTRAPHWYHYTINALSTIREVPGNKIRVSNITGETRWGSNTHVVKSGGIATVAALLVHEACHVQRRRAGRVPGGVEGESACVTIEIEVLRLLGGSNSRLSLLKHSLANIHNPAVQWWHD
ncbi:MAG: hypothetical protein OXE46_07525 [Chloroflexi bacterium]|nr:hypothetical protein [Chloroflexota bacterium]